jgi:hypothetical protein
MGVYKRADSPVYWLLLDGYRTASGAPLREKTKIRIDAPTNQQRNDNLALAKAAYHERMTALAKDGKDTPAARVPTFAERAAWFEAHELPHRKGKEREARLIPKLVAVLGPLPLTQLTRTLVTERWITPRLTTPTVYQRSKTARAQTFRAGPKTVNREVALVKAILQTAVPEFLEVSPLYGMPNLATTTPKRRLMTEQEEARLLKVMATHDTALFLLGLDSLVRLTDLLDLKRGDDHGASMWISDPKTGGGFEVPISTRARAALNAHYAALPKAKTKPAPTAYIFARRRAAKTERDRRRQIQKMLAKYCAAAKPPIPYGRAKGGIVFHWATRRTGLTRMLTRGVDLGTA